MPWRRQNARAPRLQPFAARTSRIVTINGSAEGTADLLHQSSRDLVADAQPREFRLHFDRGDLAVAGDVERAVREV
jgi:hypothetical protein